MECLQFVSTTKEKYNNVSQNIAGEKPLYYSKTGNKFYFASEAKAIKRSAIINL